jgi:hypothetical protein
VSNAGAGSNVAKAETFKQCLAEALGPLLHALLQLGDVAPELPQDALSTPMMSGATGADAPEDSFGSTPVSAAGDPTYSVLMKFYAVSGDTECHGWRWGACWRALGSVLSAVSHGSSTRSWLSHG